LNIPRIRGMVEADGFAGYSEVELFSEDWWSMPLEHVFEACIIRHRSATLKAFSELASIDSPLPGSGN
jgi:hypothetical protein